MAPSLFILGAAALAYGQGVMAAPEKSWQLTETYDYMNFFDKFDFFTSDFTTGNYNDVDPTSGYVNYRNRTDAEKLGLIATQGTEMYIGVDHAVATDPLGKGRNSVRIESKKLYNSGLFIATFTHLPAPVCGAWPAYWMYGANWPTNGEIDIYENWNTAPANVITLHTDKAADVGTCTLDQSQMSATIVTGNCDNQAQGQYENQGCGATELNGQWGSPSGGVYATEWTDDAINIWSWPYGSAPADAYGTPDPTGWGTPHLSVKSSSCDIQKAFNDQKIVLNIDFCGVTAGNQDVWNAQCLTPTEATTCKGYVASNPDAFNDVFWKIQSINVFQLGYPVVSTSTTSTTTTSTSTSSTSTTTTTTESTTTTSTESTTTTATSTSTTMATSTETETTSTTSESSTSTTETSTSTTESSTSATETSATTTETSTSATETSATYTETSTSATDTSTYTSATETGTSTSVTETSATETNTSAETSATSTWTSTATTGTETETSATETSATETSATETSATETGTTVTTPMGSVTETSTEAPVTDSSSTTSWTTSTLYTTTVYTITSCAATVTNCPAGSVTTETIAIGTTVCPVTETKTTPTPTGGASSSASLPEGWTASTVYSTTTYTITSCKAEVTDCPGKIGQVTTEIVPVYTTVCPIAGNTYVPGTGPGGSVAYTTMQTTVQATTTTYMSKPAVSSPAGGEKAVEVTYTASVVPKPSGPAGSSSPYYGGKNSTASTVAPVASTAPITTGSPAPVKVSGGVKSGVSFVLMAAGAMFVFAL